MVYRVDYRVEVRDRWGLRRAVFDDVPLLDATRGLPGAEDVVRGLLPAGIATVSPGDVLRVHVDGRLFCEADVVRVEPAWSDLRKLVLDRYVRYHAVVEVEARRGPARWNGAVVWGWANRRVSDIVREAVNRAPGIAHYTVAHAAYPDGAQREYGKFLARKAATDPLETGGIASGQWVDAARIDASGAYAASGDTIAGLVVDGVAWPPVRLLMVDCELPNRLDAVPRHPEVAAWSDARYARSAYKRAADTATAGLQQLLDTKGVDYLELNPHRDLTGAFDGRVDDAGRYLGLVFGGGECLNAALVEQGHARVTLHGDGSLLDPDLALKEFYSYRGESADSVEESDTVLTSFQPSAPLAAVLTALAYAAGGYTWGLDVDGVVSFVRRAAPDRVLFFDPLRYGVALGADAATLVNTLAFQGDPSAGLTGDYARASSAAVYGEGAAELAMAAFAFQADAGRFAEGLLDDLAYPERTGTVSFRYGDADVWPGGLLEVRDGPVRRLDTAAASEWGGVFAGRLIARVRAVTHRLAGRTVRTDAALTSPLRSVEDPLGVLTRSQPSAGDLPRMRLDDPAVGLDSVYYLA